MAVISARRGPVIGLSLLAWLVVLWRWSPLLSRGRLARPAVRVAGLAVVYLPLVLLARRGARSRGRRRELCWSCSARRCWRR